ncbi:MAG: CAP domain-containing protein [Planctomycetes bacterium]|nr:CAP domain-containing protein [Planctomycetota bacterium]
MKRRRVPAVALVALALSGPLAADTVRTVTGPIYEGKIVVRDGAGIVLETVAGKKRIDKADVFEVEEGLSPPEVLAGMVKRIGPEGGQDEIAAAARYALSKGLGREYADLVALLVKRGDETDAGKSYRDREDAEAALGRALKDPEAREAVAARLAAEPWLDAALAIRLRERTAALDQALGWVDALRVKEARRRELDRARREALAFIGNGRRYVEGLLPAPGQETVDRLVAEVTRPYDGSALPETVRGDAKVAAALSAIEERLALYRELGGKDAAGIAAEVDAVIARAAAVVDFRAEDLRRHRAVLEENEKAQGPADDLCRRMVRAINEYRMLMGTMPVLAIDEALCKAAQGHAEDMVRLDFFSHVSPVPGKRTHIDRARAAEYPSEYVSEEIAQGRQTPEETVDRWKTSASHHRGLLAGDYKEIGTGRDGVTWCFVMGDPTARRR